MAMATHYSSSGFRGYVVGGKAPSTARFLEDDQRENDRNH